VWPFKRRKTSAEQDLNLDKSDKRTIPSCRKSATIPKTIEKSDAGHKISSVPRLFFPCSASSQCELVVCSAVFHYSLAWMSHLTIHRIPKQHLPRTVKRHIRANHTFLLCLETPSQPSPGSTRHFLLSLAMSNDATEYALRCAR